MKNSKNKNEMAALPNIPREKKEWDTPDIVSIDFKKTESGGAITNFEDDTYHPDSNG